MPAGQNPMCPAPIGGLTLYKTACVPLPLARGQATAVSGAHDKAWAHKMLPKRRQCHEEARDQSTKRAPKRLPLQVSKQADNPCTVALAYRNCVMVSTCSTSSQAVRTLHSIVFGMTAERIHMPLAEPHHRSWTTLRPRTTYAPPILTSPSSSCQRRSGPTTPPFVSTPQSCKYGLF